MILFGLVVTLDKPFYAVAVRQSPLNEAPKQLIPIKHF
jgi:hypothetical protein